MFRDRGGGIDIATILIRPGDTLGHIALRHRTTIGELLRLNPAIRHPDRIFAGERLVVPGPAPVPVMPPAPPRPPVMPYVPRPAPVPVPPPAYVPRPVLPVAPPRLPPVVIPRLPELPGAIIGPAPPRLPYVPAPPRPVPPAPAPGVGFWGGLQGALGTIAGLPAGIAGFAERMGWTPGIFKLLVIGIVLTALGRVLKLRIRI